MEHDCFPDTVRPALLRALTSDRSHQVVIAWAQAISELALSAEELGRAPFSTDRGRADYLAEANRSVCEVLRLGSELEHVGETQIDEFLTRYFEAADPDIAGAWPARKALALNGHDCASCGHWEPDEFGDTCPRCGGTASHLMHMARAELQRTNPSDAILLRDLIGPEGDAIRAATPDFDHATTLVISTYTSSVWTQPEPFHDVPSPERECTSANLLDLTQGIFISVCADPDDPSVNAFQLDDGTLALAAPFIEKFRL